MKDKNRQNIAPGSLISIKSVDRLKYYYVTNCSPDEQNGCLSGYRVNKNFEFNQHDKKKDARRLFSYMPGDEITLIDPMPAAFLESLRTLHFWVGEVLEEFGVIKEKNSIFY